MTTAEPGPTPRRSTLWWALRVVPAVVALGVAVRVLASRRSELSGTATALAHLNPVWVGVGAAAECASLAAYVFLQRGLLDAGGARVGLTPLAGITLAGYAIQNSLPAGPAWSAVFAFRELRRRGADSVQAGWTMVVTALLSDASLAFLGLVGVILAHGQAAELDLVEVVAGVAVVTVLVAVAVRRGLLSTHGVTVASLFVALWRRLTRRRTDDAAAVAAAGLDRLRAVHPSRGTWAVAGVFALGNWVLDCACLALCFVAVHAGVPWRGLLLAYGTAQLAANIPITPGGLGVVEGSLSIALVYYGGAQVSTVAAVLLYRLISFWALLPVGWVSWVALRWTGRQASAVLVEEGAR